MASEAHVLYLDKHVTLSYGSVALYLHHRLAPVSGNLTCGFLGRGISPSLSNAS
jgi:hypothetical protein